MVPLPPSSTGNPDAILARLAARLDRAAATVRVFKARHPAAIRCVAAITAGFCVLIGWFTYQVLAGLPGRDELRELGEAIEGTTIFDVRDRPIFSIPTRYRVEVPLDRISPHLRRAIVAVEDIRFYEHDGIDGVRVLGAILTDLRERRAAEGASTITQQLARMSFLTRDKTLRRKAREAVLAQRIEHLYSKDQILEIYLNKVYFGDGLYGAEAAAQGFFGKPAAELTLGEAATLAGIVKAPSTANPSANVERAIDRRNVVLKLMLEHGFIDRASYDSATVERMALVDNLRHDEPIGLHFKEVVRRQLIEKFGKEKVYEGRLRVFTTIDPEMQKAAEAAVTGALAEIESRIPRKGREPLQGALFALDAATGEVRAMVGGRDTSSIGLNRAIQSKRQPGSAFKPFVYAAALESGYSPATIIDRLNDPVETYEGAWLPEDEHSTAASLTLRTALRTSNNRAAVKVLEQVGIQRALLYAEHLGVGTLPSVPSLALGSGEVTLASITSAYGAFAQSGVVRDPVFIRRVEDPENGLLFQGDSNPRQAVSETTAFLMATMLADVVDAGTANRARALGFTHPAAGKTGTTNDFVDAWFVGFTPRLVAGVWVGFDRPRTIVKNGYAGLLAVPMWARFMKAVTANDPEAWFEPPPDVVSIEVCRVSGQLPGEGCRNTASIGPTGEITYKSMVYTDHFVRGTEPLRTCTAHLVEYLPYPEPYFAVGTFEDVIDLANAPPVEPPLMPAVARQPVNVPVRGSSAAVPPAILPAAPVSQRGLPDLPPAPPDPAPVSAATPPAEHPQYFLPPPAPPEAPPMQP
jgi:penicillin-binding protein 1A